MMGSKKAVDMEWATIYKLTWQQVETMRSADPTLVLFPSLWSPAPSGCHMATPDAASQLRYASFVGVLTLTVTSYFHVCIFTPRGCLLLSTYFKFHLLLLKSVQRSTGITG